MKWADLKPEPGILDALQHAGSKSVVSNQNEKRRWSEIFANGCAIAIADGFKKSKIGNASTNRKVLPISLEKGTEPFTPLGSSNQKRIDVTIVDPVLGLEVGVSLKGMNFRDRQSKYFDKNVTRCLYETVDEMRMVHEHLPHAFMASVFFLPIDATDDKARSSFAHTVTKLRERTTRLDVALAAHASRCDTSFVALYADGEDDFQLPAGVTRFFDTTNARPKRGRPQVNMTVDLIGMVEIVISKATNESVDVWTDPEAD